MLLNAQLTSENFDTLTVGSFDTQWDPASWTGWFGGASGSNISDALANSGANSLEIAQDNDLVALLGTLNIGTYEVSFMQYIPAGNGAYFNFQHNYTNTAGDWAAEVYFSDDATAQGVIVTDGVQTPFTIVHETWVEHKLVANFNTMTAEYYYNGAILHVWALNTNAAGGPGLNQLNGINFYGACLDGGAGCTSLAYYDDIDVVYTPPPAYDLVLAEFTPPNEYTIIPVGLETGARLEANVSNVGGNAATNVSVTFSVSDGSGVVFTDTSPALATLATGTASTFAATNSFTPTAGTAYTVDYTVNLDETDGNLANNAANTSFSYSVDDVLDYEYARDDGTYTNGIGVNNATGMIGHAYDFPLPVGVSAINTSSGGGGLGEYIMGHIFSTNADGSPNMLMASTDSTIIDTQGTTGGGDVFYTLNFPATVYLPVGEYVFLVEQRGLTNLLISTAESIYTPGKSWATLDNGATWSNLEDFGFAVAVNVRPVLNGVDVVDITEPIGHVNALSIQPNPTSGKFMLDIELSEAKSLMIEVYNAQGQLVNTNNIGNTLGGVYAMDLSAMSSGVYFARCLIGEQILTQRIVVSR